MSEKIRKLDALLNEALKKSPLARGLREQEVLTGWPEIVGEEIARHSRAVSINEGVLFVQVEGSVWSQELTMLKTNICKRFNQRLGSRVVRDIRFRSGENP